MYPQWVTKSCRAICADCRGCANYNNINAIGLARPDPGNAYASPLALFIVACPICGERMSVTVRKPVEAVIEAMRIFTTLVEEAARNPKPPLQLRIRNLQTGARTKPPLPPNVD